MKKLSFVLLGIIAAGLSSFNYNVKEELSLPAGFSSTDHVALHRDPMARYMFPTM